MEIVERSIILTFDELRILLYSQGCTSCEGVFMPAKDFSRQDILNALNKLASNGLLSIDREPARQEALPLVFMSENDDAPGDVSNDGDEIFFIRKDLLKIIRVIAEHIGSEVIVTESGHNLFCYYAENCVVTSERYSKRRNNVRLTYYDLHEFEEMRNYGGEIK